MDDHQSELDFERQMNADYLRLLDQRAHYPVAGQAKRSADPWGCLTARVRLSPSPNDDSEFYIGPRALPSLQGVRVVSWAAEAAAVHFQGLSQWNDQRVLVRRAFRGSHTITDFAQDPPVTEGPAFPRSARRPNLPPATAPEVGHSAQQRPAPTERDTESAERAAQLHREALARLRGRGRELGLRPPEQEPPSRGSAVEAGTASSGKKASPNGSPGSFDDMLVKSLRAPRRGQLGQVLATLRPDQFDLIVRPPEENLIVEGHPGTGKSVVATHRAAWLANPHRPGVALPEEVVLIGPTEGWRQHVKSSIRTLTDGGKVRVLSLPRLLGSFLQRVPWAGPLDGPLPSVSEDTGILIAQLVGHFRPTNGRAWLPIGYEQLRTWKPASGAEVDPSVIAWRRELPPYSRAVEDLRLWPALAYLAGLLQPPKPVAHVVIDEAQDIRPLEWMILSLLSPTTWTIVGDLNQRRAEHSYRDWPQVVGLLGGDWPEPVTLAKGYRSTQAIMDMAASVLPKRGGRANAVLGAGEPVAVLNARELKSQVETVALRTVKALTVKYAKGTVALIYPHTQLLMPVLRKNGWTPHEHGDDWWTKPGPGKSESGEALRFRLLNPEQARGIEFDAVVILEPADFPKTTLLGHGQLYTAITRANREVVLVHDKPLAPSGLADAVKRLPTRSAHQFFQGQGAGGRPA